MSKSCYYDNNVTLGDYIKFFYHIMGWYLGMSMYKGSVA